MMTSSQPETSAIRSSRRRKPSDTFSKAFMAEAGARTGAARGRAGAAVLLRLRRRCGDVGRLQLLRVAPDGVLLAESDVVVGDLLEGRILGRLVLDHFEPGLLEGGERLVVPALDLHLVLVAHLGHSG